MPRKGSRKSILEKKPKLKFVKSPVQGPGCPISPVLGALHPLTARARAADDSNLTWISPNFQELARQGLSTSKLKLLRGRRAVTRQRHDSCDKENQSFKRTALGRLKPLMFVEDENTTETVEYLQSFTPPRNTSVSDDLDLCPTADVRTPELQGHSPSDEKHETSNIPVKMVKGRQPRKSFGDEICKAPNLIESPLRILNFSCDDDQCLDQSQVRRSSRLREKYLESVKLLHTPPRSVQKDMAVLVADTPESDYGLSLRGRQLAQLKGKIFAKTS